MMNLIEGSQTMLTIVTTAIIHGIALVLVIGYPMTYYFHLRESDLLLQLIE